MITEIKDTDILCVDVPADAKNYKFGELFTTTLYWDSEKGGMNEYLKQGEYKILGEGTKDKIIPEVSYEQLAANGIYFENPLGAAKYATKNDAYMDKGEIFYNEWQSYEEKLVEKLLFIQKIK